MAVSLGELALRLGCELKGDPQHEVAAVDTLANAGAGALSFLANPAYRKWLPDTRAGAVICTSEAAAECPVNALIHADPYRKYAEAAALLYPEPAATGARHSTAVVADDATISPSADIGAHAAIGTGCVLGERVRIGPGCVLGEGVAIGDDTRLFANVSVGAGARIGRRCRIQSGAVIGSDGFGFAPGAEGWRRVPQVGSVQIGDDVDIGACTTIDRGAIGDTIIGDDVKLDNLVQIAHNVSIGAHTAMAAQVGIAGSTTIGERCLFAGHSGAVGHVTICDGVIVSGKGMITKDITEPGQYGSALPAEEMRQYRRTVARIRQLDKMAERLKKLEQRERGGSCQ